MTEESKKKLRDSHLGQIPWNKDKEMPVGYIPKNKGQRGIYHHSETAKEKIRIASIGRPRSLETRKKSAIARRGEKSHFWKGGKTKEAVVIRTSFEYKNWREEVFKRDNHTCQFCLIRGGELNAHHIRPFALFPALRFDISNGITLCESCHKTTPFFGQGSKDIYAIVKATHENA